MKHSLSFATVVVAMENRKKMPLPSVKTGCIVAAGFVLSLGMFACGGGGGLGDGSGGGRVIVAPYSRYTPNYASELGELRRWKNLPIKVWFGTTTTYEGGTIEASTIEGGTIEGGTIEGGTIEALLRQGFHQWESTMGTTMWVETQQSSEADLEVRVTVGLPHPDQLGTTNVQFYEGEREVQGAQMIVWVWKGMSSSDIAQVVTTGAHEFGHALGLGGHSSNAADVMFEFAHAGDGVPITTADYNTMLTAYNGFGTALTRGSLAEERALSGQPGTRVLRSVTYECPLGHDSSGTGRANAPRTGLHMKQQEHPRNE